MEKVEKKKRGRGLRLHGEPQIGEIITLRLSDAGELG
jgi:hypothetical protein